MRARTAFALAATTALAACASTEPAGDDRAAQALARELAGRTAGPPQRCIAQFRNQAAPVIYGRSLLYRDGRTLWVSDVSDCPGLTGDPILVIEMFGSQSCEHDRFRTIPRGGIAIPGPICQFGKFTPYRKAG